jgi:hypothetical protein
VLVVLVSYHVIFMVMAIVVAGSVLYLCLTLRGQLLRPVAAFEDAPQTVAEEVVNGAPGLEVLGAGSEMAASFSESADRQPGARA